MCAEVIQGKEDVADMTEMAVFRDIQLDKSLCSTNTLNQLSDEQCMSLSYVVRFASDQPAKTAFGRIHSGG